jgi:hypothetical protein
MTTLCNRSTLSGYIIRKEKKILDHSNTLNRKLFFSILAKQAAPQHSSNKFDSAFGLHSFSLSSWHSPIGMMVWKQAFIWELAHKGKHADTTSRTSVLP